MSLLFDIGEKARRIARFLGSVHRELQFALEEEKSARKLTQQQIADEIGVNRSVINRQILGGGNLTIRRVAELAIAMGREPVLELRKPAAQGNYAYPPPKEAAPVPLTPPPPSSEMFGGPKIDEILGKDKAPVPTV
jgi:transcriptional regulator with XRE-family HTH domain